MVYIVSGGEMIEMLLQIQKPKSIKNMFTHTLTRLTRETFYISSTIKTNGTQIINNGSKAVQKLTLGDIQNITLLI